MKTLQVVTYQSLEKNGRCRVDTDFIVCDECHYFWGDSLYNYGTWRAFVIVMNSRGGKIFITVTMDEIKGIIDNYRK